MTALYWLARAMAWLVAGLGVRGVAALGSGVGALVWLLAGSRRRVACTSIAERLGLEPEAARRIARQSFKNNFKSFLEITRSRRVGPRFLERRVDVVQPDVLAALEQCAGPVIVATAHLGSWEYINGVLDLFQPGRNKLVIMRAGKGRIMNWLMIDLRTRPGVDILEHRRAAPLVVERLRSGAAQVAAFLVDHNCLEKEAVFLPFLGKVAAVNRGPAMLAVKTRAWVFPAALIREKGGRFALHFGEPLDTKTLPGSVKERIALAADHYTRAVEHLVRAHPEQWFWMHKRWKTRPPGEPDAD